ncbi:MAG: hypothetical protein OXG44_17405 [Gammaproteobacteria bacterium]|nr:hypothetical protein [Gammaproteobacteria bacterium]
MWGWVDVPAAISDWLAMQGYHGGHLPLAWWAAENPGQQRYDCEGAQRALYVASPRELPSCQIADGRIAKVGGIILCRMYSGSYHSWFSGHRHGHPTTVVTESGPVQASWIGIAAAEILPTGGSAHGLAP